MKRARMIGIALLFCLPFATASAAEVELQRDGFQSMQAAAFQGGFADGERFAVKFNSLAPSDFPLQVTKLTFLYGGGTTTKNVVPYVWVADGTGITSILGGTGGGFPGSPIWFSQDEYQITGSNDAFQQIDVTDQNVLVPSGPFWVGLQLNNGCSAGSTCFPGPARDNDGISAQYTNAIYAVDGSWYDNSVFQVNGDWVLRVTVLTSTGTTTDIVADPGADAPADTAADTTTTADTSTGTDTTPADVSFDIVSPDPLTITQVTPTRATQGQETLIQVRGTGFVEGLTLRLSATPLLDITVASGEILNATVPGTLSVGIHDLIAQVPSGAIFTYPSAFEVTSETVEPTGPPPAITSVVPAEGRAGDNVTVNGINFDSALTLAFGAEMVTASAFADGTGAVFVVPANAAPGSYAITVTNPDGQSDTRADAFTVIVGGGGGGDDGCGCTVTREDSSRSTGAVLFAGLVIGAMMLRRRRSS